MKQKKNNRLISKYACMNEQIYFSWQEENRLNRERRNWTSSFPERVNPALSPADDRPRANCRRMQFAHRVGKPVEAPPGACLSVAARLSVRDDRAARTPASALKHRRTSHCRARARVQTRIHTYIRTSRCDGARTSVRAKRIAHARGWHPGEFSCTYVRKKKRTRGKKGERQRDDSLEERGGTRPGTHASRDVDAAPRLYDGAYLHRRTHGRTRPSKPHATTPSQSDVGSGPTIHPGDTLSLLRTDVSHGYATRLYGGPRREGDTRWDWFRERRGDGRRRALEQLVTVKWSTREGHLRRRNEERTRKTEEKGVRVREEKVGERGRGLHDATGGPDSERWQERGTTVLDKASVKRRGLIGTSYVIGTLKRAFRLKQERKTCDKISLLTRWTRLRSFSLVLDISSWSNPWLRLPRDDEL